MNKGSSSTNNPLSFTMADLEEDQEISNKERVSSNHHRNELRHHEDKTKRNIIHKCKKCHRVFSRLVFLQSHKCVNSAQLEKLLDRTKPKYDVAHEDKNKQNKHHQVHKGIDNIKKEQLSDEEVHKCDMCEKSFFTGRSLEAHRYTRHGKETKCDSCKESLVYREARGNRGRFFLQSHKCEFVHEEKNKQNKDHQVHKGINNIKKEQLSDEEVHKCDMCEKSFFTGKSLEAHRYTIHGKEIKCDSCKESFVYRETLEKHVRLFHEENKNPINFSMADLETEKEPQNDGGEFGIGNNKEDIRKQIRKHNNNVKKEKRTEKEDNKRKITNQEMKESTIVNKSLQYDICEESFVKGVTLKNEKKKVHEDHKCEICDKSFIHATALKQHICATYIGTSNEYRCEFCDKLFSKSDNLKTHVYTVHEGHKDYKCESCCKSFSHAHHLRRHIHTIHQGLKDHKCDSCGKLFSEARNLKKHIQAHHGGHKGYKCESCGKSFSEGGSLKKHVYEFHKSHKDYKCESCGKRFYQDIFLKKHVFTVHEGRKLQQQIEFKPKNRDVEKINRKLSSLVSHKKNTNYIRKRKPINFSMDDLEAEKDQENDGEFYIDNKENITGQIRKHDNIKKEKRTEKGRNKRKATYQEIIEKTSQKIVKKRKPPINFSMTDLETENDDEEFGIEKLPIE